MKFITQLCIWLIFSVTYAQIGIQNRVVKKIANKGDTIHLAKVAISPFQFEVLNQKGDTLPKSDYFIDFEHSNLVLPKTTDSIQVAYFKYPDFITKSYSYIDESFIYKASQIQKKTYAYSKETTKATVFGDLNTYGNITRGITFGNNQNAILNSGLDLQISGYLTDQLQLRASIKDSNLPIQQNGVSQNIQEFDRVYIEMFTDHWNVSAGDIDIKNENSRFLNFQKKLTGAKLTTILNPSKTSELQIGTSVALVKGKFVRQIITCVDGNQGPYRLKGSNGETNIIIISGSEHVYLNGNLVKRGSQNDYTIDYNTGEITFNATYPINAAMRMIVEFQYNDRNYNRFATYNHTSFKNNQTSLAVHYFEENDVKSQPLQQNFTASQLQVLKDAGNNTSLMIASSESTATYDENRIQYKKTLVGTTEIFEFSTQKNDILYNVNYSYVGNLKGDYILKQTVAIGSIFEYVGTNLGDYAPIIPLVAPTKKEVVMVKVGYENDLSSIQSEWAVSNNDANLFSTKDDTENIGIAGNLDWKHKFTKKLWHIQNQLHLSNIQQNFNTIERFNTVEFTRDWNLTSAYQGNQQQVQHQIAVQKNKQRIILDNQYLGIGNQYKGIKTNVKTNYKYQNSKLINQVGVLKNKSSLEEGTFIRTQNTFTQQWNKTQSVVHFLYEKNNNTTIATQKPAVQNFKNLNTGINIILGDTLKVYHKIGYEIQLLDSVKNQQLTNVQKAHQYHLQNQLIQNQQAQLHTSIFFRSIQNEFIQTYQNVLNGRLIYNQQLYKGLVQLNTVYETISGSTPKQHFSYIETPAGQGYFTYLGDLNNNGIKDFDEFEVAQFQDQATYLKVLLPTTTFVATQAAKLNQSIFLNFYQWKQAMSTWKRFVAHFANQTNILLQNNQLKTNESYNINPFLAINPTTISLQQQYRNMLFFNRGLQHFSTTYTFANNQQLQTIATDVQENNATNHEVNFLHNIAHTWLIAIDAKIQNTSNQSSLFNTRNFNLVGNQIKPTLSFLKDEYQKIALSYLYKSQQNTLGIEQLNSNQLLLNYEVNKLDKGTVLANFSWIENQFVGKNNSPAAYKMLEGLQPNKNYTWSLILQKKLNALLDLNITYNGRMSQNSPAIHIGSVQLRANF